MMKIPPLLDTARLEQSAVVANNRMNRERVLFGVNSYQKEFGLDLLGFLAGQIAGHGEATWIDLCCGTGNALVQAAESLDGRGLLDKARLEGLDLVDMFSPVPPQLRRAVHLQVGSVFAWKPERRYDLITCVHGFHYLGDKLGFLRHAFTLLKADGLLVVNLDPQNLKTSDGKPMDAWWRQQCKQHRWKYDGRRHLLTVAGPQDWPVEWEFLGSDDEAGPNYSRQPVVDSYYHIAGI